jgi:Spy/CpxP family protein refolding chaperone
MKKSIFIMAVMISSSVAFSQSSSTDSKVSPTENVKKEGDVKYQEMLKSLNLTDDQKSILKQINKSNKDAKMKVTNDTTLSEISRKEQLKEIKNNKSKSFMDLLTPDQLEKYKEFKKENSNKE